MPNWCYNSVRLRPDTKEKGEALIEELKKDNSKIFNHLHPMPEEFRSTESPNRNADQAAILQEKYGYSDWYDWAINEWGTKWDVAPNSWDVEGEDICISFDTAWGPPIELYNKLVNEGWSVVANYCEEGCCFVGEYVDGQDDFYDYSGMSADDVAGYIPVHLDEEYGISENMREWEEIDEQLEDEE